MQTMSDTPHDSLSLRTPSSLAAAERTQHICVCICTYKRPGPLQRLLKGLEGQETQGLFSFSVVVADNDAGRSAEAIVAEFTATSPLPVRYCVEPRQNIALARNKAVENTDGEFVAWIDDDEFPAVDWLLTLFKTCQEYQVDGVLGPVLRHFDETPPRWLLRSQFYKRKINPTGTTVRWLEARTGNVLLKRELLQNGVPPFRPEFRAGEDQDFFRRQIEQGRNFIWSENAAVYEVIPPARWRRSYMLRKALLRGSTAAMQPSYGAVNITKSIVAVPIYIMALPFALLLGHHRFMTLLVRLCDHLGKLMRLAGINPIRDQYVTD
jgi:succinoglycan biosynthesis protein ExoM